MNKYEKLLKKLNNNERIKLLFVSPDYTGIYPYSHVETNYFNKEKYECDVRLIKNENIEEIIILIYYILLHNFYIENELHYLLILLICFLLKF